jgi:hypothetical protein
MTDETQTNTEEQKIAVPEEILNIADLVNIANLIEVVTQRGAIRADELTAAGALYDKLRKFLETVLPKEEATEGTDTTATTEGTYEFQGE